jgi:hypothetical protein
MNLSGEDHSRHKGEPENEEEEHVILREKCKVASGDWKRILKTVTEKV